MEKIQNVTWANNADLRPKQEGMDAYIVCDSCNQETSRDYDVDRDYCDRCGTPIT